MSKFVKWDNISQRGGEVIGKWPEPASGTPDPLLEVGTSSFLKDRSHQHRFRDLSPKLPTGPGSPGTPGSPRRRVSILERPFQSRWGSECPNSTCARWSICELWEQPPAGSSSFAVGLQLPRSFGPDPQLAALLLEFGSCLVSFADLQGVSGESLEISSEPKDPSLTVDRGSWVPFQVSKDARRLPTWAEREDAALSCGHRRPSGNRLPLRPFLF